MWKKKFWKFLKLQKKISRSFLNFSPILMLNRHACKKCLVIYLFPLWRLKYNKAELNFFSHRIWMAIFLIHGKAFESIVYGTARMERLCWQLIRTNAYEGTISKQSPIWICKQLATWKQEWQNYKKLQKLKKKKKWQENYFLLLHWFFFC